MSKLRLSTRWIDPPPDEDLSQAERATFAEIRIALDDAVLTHVADHAGDRQHIVGPVSGLAEWIVENWLWALWESLTPFPKSPSGSRSGPPGAADAASWWRDAAPDLAAMGRWQQRHTFGVAASDLALPSIVLLPEEQAVGVFVSPAPSALDPTTSLLCGDREPAWVRVEDMRDQLGRVVDDSLDRARALGAERWATWLGERWAETKIQERDPRRRLSAALGDFAAERWADADEALHADLPALRGLLLDTPMVCDQSTWMRRLEAVVSTRSPTARARKGSSGSFRRAAGAPAHVQGQAAAVRFREALSNVDEPLLDLDGALDAVGAQLQPVDTVEFRSAVIRTAEGSSRVMVARSLGHAARRFAVAAAIGRVVTGPANGAFGAAHGSSSRWFETRRANAFAAELLLPAAALDARRGEDTQQLSDDFGISFKAASWQRANRTTGHGEPS